jgi:hypothetical protein
MLAAIFGLNRPSSGQYLQKHMHIIIIIIIIQPLGQFGQEPEPSQATGIALVRCILGEFLGVVCHCFPPHIICTNEFRFL